MCEKMAVSHYILKIMEKGPFLRLQMRAKEMFNRHQFFSTNKQYLKIKLMQNETNHSSIFLVKTKYWQNFKLVNFTLLKYVKSQRSYGFLITKELIFGFQILDLKDHFSASLIRSH